VNNNNNQMDQLAILNTLNVEELTDAKEVRGFLIRNKFISNSYVTLSDAGAVQRYAYFM
jgi:hypothetical protein